MSKTRSPVSVVPADAVRHPALWPTAAHAPEGDDLDVDVLADLADTLDGLLNISDQARKKLSQVLVKQEGSLAASFQVAVENARGILPARLLTAIEKWRDQNHSRDERLYVIYNLPEEDVDMMVKNALLDPFDVFEEAAFVGNLERLKDIHDALGLSQLDGWRACLDRALSCVAVSTDILEGALTSTQSTEVAQQLLAWGANPNAADGQVWQDVLKGGDGTLIKAFLDHGADIVPLLHRLKDIYLQGDVFGKRYFGKLDEQTLLEITFMPPLSSTAHFTYDSFLRTIYCFDRARVTEIIQTDGDIGQPSSVITRALSELPVAVIRDRHAKLRTLGGKPVELEGIAINDPKRTAMFKPRTP